MAWVCSVGVTKHYENSFLCHFFNQYKHRYKLMKYMSTIWVDTFKKR